MTTLLRTVTLVWALSLGVLCAAATLGIQPVSEQHDAIVAAMARLDADHVQQRAACQKKFLVNRCLEQVDSDYRLQHRKLQDQLNAQDLAQRQQRAAEQEHSNAEKQSQLRQVDPDQIRRAQQQREQRQRDLQLQQEQHQQVQPQAARQRPNTVATPTPGGSAAERQQTYRKRQQQAASQAAQRPPAAALPLPPTR